MTAAPVNTALPPATAEIVLATLNARYHHSSLALRYLLANLGELAARTVLREFTINQTTAEILEAILACQPRIVALGVYIWNIDETTRLVADLKRLAPHVRVVLGGPEVSYDVADLEVARLADVIIAGEADLEFPRVCRELLEAITGTEPPRSLARVISAAVPPLAEISLPYGLYTDRDLAERVLYVEASRGCPYTCEFCLSALDVPVRQFPLDRLLPELERLLARGARTFKFVDRTFNLNLKVTRQLLDFFLDRLAPELFLHFEMIPDRFPEPLFAQIARFPPGALQFEIGIQSTDPGVGQLISRRQDLELAEANLRRLRRETGVHLHTDLIVGLPGETLESFARGFDWLVALEPHEIQVGLLKRLRGTPIIRHDQDWGMVYSQSAPYELLQNRLLDFATVQRLKRFARYWDQLANSGNFRESLPRLWHNGSPFTSFLAFSDWLFERQGRAHAISLNDLLARLLEYLVEQLGQSAAEVSPILLRDYQRSGRSDTPSCLRAALSGAATAPQAAAIPPRAGQVRQRRHQA